MKIPKYEKDRTLTRRTVAGAAGGMKGVDYEDDRRIDPSAKAGPEAERIQKAKLELLRLARNEAAAAHRAAGASTAFTEEVSPLAAPKEEQEMILDDEDATTRDNKAKQKRRVVSRDRFTVDKDAPDRRRRVRWDLLLEDEEEDEDFGEETGEISLDPIAESVYGAPRAHLFEPEVRPAPGVPGLLRPEDIRTVFPAPLDYAKHCMLLVETFAQTTGAFRHEVVEYAASLFTGLSDPRFGRRALLAWGPDSGIINLYPLEVVEHILLTCPTFLPRVRFGRWLALELGDDPKFELTVHPDLPLNLTVPGDILVRGFAIKGGYQPGYCFEPGPSLETYALSLTTPGLYDLLMSARTNEGDTLVDRLLVRVVGQSVPAPPLPPRDPERIAQWPRPDVFESLEEDDPLNQPTVQTGGGIDPHELARRQQLDAMGGPKGEQADPLFGMGLDAARAPLRSGATAQPGPPVLLEAPEDVSLSVAEIAVLRLSLAAGATYADIQVAGAVPTDENEPTEVLPAWPDTSVEPAYDHAPSVLEGDTEAALTDDDDASFFGRNARRAAAAAAPAGAEALDKPARPEVTTVDTQTTTEHAGGAGSTQGIDAGSTQGDDAGKPSADDAAQSRATRPAEPLDDEETVEPTVVEFPKPYAIDAVLADAPKLDSLDHRAAPSSVDPANSPGQAGLVPPIGPIAPAPFKVAVEFTHPDAPAVVGKPKGVVSGTQAQVPGESGPTDRIDLVGDLMTDAAPQQPIEGDEDDEDP
ncbi:MAG: hypothetical protein AAFV29_03770 [Myxococcota bacterium]